MTKYGFDKDIKLPDPRPESVPEPAESDELRKAVAAGEDLGFVDREPTVRLKPGPKRREPQDKVSIPGPKRVTDEFRDFCRVNDLTLWQGLEVLLAQHKTSFVPK